jgi:hypothetical protein
MAVGSATPDHHHSRALHAPLDNTMARMKASNNAEIVVRELRVEKNS